jgi:undecaprenyl-diphosphatase
VSGADRRSPRAWIGAAREAASAVRRHRDAALLAILLVLSAGGAAVAGLADVIAEDEARAAEARVLMTFREAGDPADPVGGAGIEEAVRDLTALGGVLVTTLVTLSAVGFLLIARRPREALFLAVTIGGGIAVTFALKAGFDRARPDLVVHGMRALSASFPSGHAATSAVVYLTLGALVARALPRRGLRVYVVALAALLTLGIGVSRLYLGVHWPTDVLAGWAVGTGWALAAWLGERYARRRGWLERAGVWTPKKSRPARTQPEAKRPAPRRRPGG